MRAPAETPRRGPRNDTGRRLFIACLLGLLPTCASPAGQGLTGTGPDASHEAVDPPAIGISEDHGASPDFPYGRLHPAAPPETEQYAFMVGTFECWLEDKEFRAGEWVKVREGRAIWRARFVMNGLAIMDEFWKEWGSHAVNIRMFSTEEDVWKIHFVARERPEGEIFDARKIDKAMVMDADRTTESGFEYVQRFAFHPHGPDRYLWTNAVVYEDGTTVTIGTIECDRSEGPGSGEEGPG